METEDISPSVLGNCEEANIYWVLLVGFAVVLILSLLKGRPGVQRERAFYH